MEFSWKDVEGMYVMGITPSVGKRIAYYAFRDNMIHFAPHPVNRTYTIWLKYNHEVEQEHINDFLETWNKKYGGFIVKVMPE